MEDWCVVRRGSIAALTLHDATRKKRAPSGADGRPMPSPLSLAAGEGAWSAISRDQDPEAAFHAQWAASLVREVLEKVRIDCMRRGQQAYWEVFARRVVRPKLHGESPEPYEHLVANWGIADAAQAANMMVMSNPISVPILSVAGSASTVLDSERGSR